MQVKESESQNKFILDYWSAFITTDDRQSQKSVIPFIRGRIFPQKDPYCLASFLIEMKFPSEYPFKPPEVRILDPIYHPNFREDGTHFCGWEYNDKTWNPHIQLTTFIEGLIQMIDNVDPYNYCHGTRSEEYRNNYEQFYEKALRCTLDYGRPRF